MTNRLLIILGLVIIPFYELILRVFPFVRSIAPDSRAPKEILAMIFALSIGLLAVYLGQIKKFNNKYFLVIPIYLLFNLIIAPHVSLVINNVESGDFYFWKPFCEVLCFMLMIIAISSMEINFEIIIKTMVICGTIMAVYMILQKLGLDQFWAIKTEQVFTSVRAEAIGGNLGQPTIAASFIVMMIPLSIYLRKYWMTLTIITAVFLTGSAMSIGAIIFMLLISTVRYLKIKRFTIIISSVIIICIGFICFSNKTFHNKIEDRMDGRYTVWSNIVHDIHYGQIKDGSNLSLTGVGFGRFPYLFPQKHHSPFQQAHNDLMEFTYDCGLIGLGLLIMFLFFMIKNTNGMNYAVMLSFIALLFTSLGSFSFQLGAHQFYAAVLVGMLNNNSLIKGE